MFRNKTKYLWMLAIMLLIISCRKKMSEEDMKAEERLQIQNFLSLNDTLTFVPTSSGLYHTDLTVGTGPGVVTDDNVWVFYTMKLLNGTLIESNALSTDTLVFQVGKDEVIKGFDEGVTYMKQGGESLFILPSQLAFGDGKAYGVRSYTPLLLNVKLLKVKQH
ncbi:MAG: FKBP-type peptidyl-prolyl cis-trans isomerase [Chloroflexota bacterium]